jgi:hypothetical protein
MDVKHTHRPVAAPNQSALLKNTLPATRNGPAFREIPMSAVQITPQELRVVLDLAALATRPVGEAFRLHDILVRTAQLADQPRPIGALEPEVELGGVFDSTSPFGE